MRNGRVNLVTLWLAFSVWAAVSGWLLSALRLLNGLGWMASFLILLIALWCDRRGTRWLPGMGRLPVPAGVRLRRWRRRFSCPLPALYLVVAVCATLGGALHPPSNYDALTYRLPRMLQWLAEGRWHWIVTSNERMNYAGVGFEWLQTPVFLLAGGDRLLWVLNVIPFLLLPGLLFLVFRQLGVRGRVARFWMWFFPVSYGYALQAGAIGNDSFSAIYLLAGMHHGLRARENRKWQDLALALLAASLLTGVKISNAPLVLPVVLAIGLAPWASFWRRPLAGLATCALCAAVSILPIAAITLRLAGHWTGDPANTSLMRLEDPIAGLVGNSLQLVAQSAAPPVLPGARRIESELLASVPATFLEWLRDRFPRFSLRLGELPQEETTGFGLGCSVLVGALLAAALLEFRWLARTLVLGPPRLRIGLWVAIGGWAATLVFMAKLGSECTGRLLQPFSPLWILPLAITPTAVRWHSRRWWKLLAIASASSTVFVLALTPARPLIPVEDFLNAIQRVTGESAQLARAREVYAVYDRRNDVLSPLRQHLTRTAEKIGYIGGIDDTEYALWRPFGTRRVVHLFDGRRLEPQTRPPMEWVVIKQEVWERHAGMPFEQWLIKHGGEIVATEIITSKVSAGRETWWVARFPAVAR